MDSVADICGKALAAVLSLVLLAACPARAEIATNPAHAELTR